MSDKPSAAFDFEPHYVAVEGHRLHYIEAGSGVPIVLVHGNPGWTYTWRNVIPHLKPAGRVIALDLIGMGLSDKPDLPYDYFLQLGYFDRFLRELGLDRCILIGHDAGAALCLSLAVRRPDLPLGLALMEPISLNRLVPEEHQNNDAPWWPELMEIVGEGVMDPVRGPALVTEGNVYNKRVVPLLTKRKLSDEVLAGYTSAYPDPQSRRAQRMWPVSLIPSDANLGTRMDLAAHLAYVQRAEIPRLLIYSNEGMTTPSEAEWLADNVPGLETVAFGDGYHFLQEEDPARLGTQLADWLARSGLDRL